MAKRPRLPGFKIGGPVNYKPGAIKSEEVYAECKHDGLRGVIVVGKSSAVAYTRNGCKASCNVDHILKAVVASGLFVDSVLDGEYLSFPNWNKSISIVQTQTPHPDAGTLQFHAFDLLTKKEWDTKEGTQVLRVRKAKLRVRIAKFQREASKKIKSYLQYTPHTKLPNVQEELVKFMQRKYKEGHEGAVVKDPESVYVFRKYKSWLKLKPYQEDDLVIVGAVEGKPGKTGKYLGTLGALILEGKVSGKQVKFQCSGMEDADRHRLWKLHLKGKLVGHWCEVRHEGLTVNNKVRFPRLRRMRPDKD